MNIISLRIFIVLLYFKIDFFTFLPSGIAQLNNFLYFQRLSYFVLQNNINKCSFSNGPYCFYMEPNYIRSLDEQKQIFKKEYIEKDWILINDNLNVYSIQDIFDNLKNKIQNYYQSNINKKDKQQQLPIQEYQVDITFEKYDSITIKKDIYLERKTYLKIPNENIPLIIDGKIRLKYDDSKIIIKGMIDYPSKTYAVIESNKANISLNGRNFKCISFFVRPKDMSNNRVTIIGSMTKNINIEGYINNKLVYSKNYQYSFYNEKHWTKVILSDELFINKLTISGNLEIDNLSLSIEMKNVYDIESLFYSNPKRKVVELINDNDI